jgi:3-hydroxyacyl-CoA dehydrogenase
MFVHGYGFPGHLGGPMWFAGRIGLREVYRRICEFHRQHGQRWAPAPLLRDLADSGRDFAEA